MSRSRRKRRRERQPSYPPPDPALPIGDRRALVSEREMLDEAMRRVTAGYPVEMGRCVGKSAVAEAIALQFEIETNRPSIPLKPKHVSAPVGHFMPFKNWVKFWMRPKKFSAPYPKETLAELERLWEPDKENE